MPKLTISQPVEWYFECRYGEVKNALDSRVIDVSDDVLNQIKIETFTNVKMILEFLRKRDEEKEVEI